MGPPSGARRCAEHSQSHSVPAGAKCTPAQDEASSVPTACGTPRQASGDLLQRIEEAVVLRGLVEEVIGPDQLALTLVLRVRVVGQHEDLRLHGDVLQTDLAHDLD